MKRNLLIITFAVIGLVAAYGPAKPLVTFQCLGNGAPCTCGANQCCNYCNCPIPMSVTGTCGNQQ